MVTVNKKRYTNNVSQQMFHLNCFFKIEEYSQSTDSFTLLFRTATEPNAAHGKAQMSDISQPNAKQACMYVCMYVRE